MWNLFEVVCFSLHRYTEGSEKGCGSFILVHSLWVVVCSSGFVSFFPQKMSYLRSWVGCTCVLLSPIGKVFRQQQLLRPHCCCCPGRLLVLREWNEQHVLTESIKMNMNNNYLYTIGFCSAIPNLTWHINARENTRPRPFGVYVSPAKRKRCTVRTDGARTGLLRDSEPSLAPVLALFRVVPAPLSSVGVLGGHIPALLGAPHCIE